LKLLALDTAGEGCSVALCVGERIFERFEAEPRRHAATLLPMAEACLTEAGLELGELDAVAFGRGPGSFTGLRIATGVAQGIGFGARLPVVPVSNLAAGAAAAFRLRGWRLALVAFDARMGEIFAGSYRIGEDALPEAHGVDALLKPEALSAPGGPGWHGVGSAFSAWPILAAQLGLVAADGNIMPLARDLLGLAAAAVARGEAVAAEDALPVYLREWGHS
jgi:tRNA threonylcarbamoyladenosine biosynthesis protein TsaB